MADCVGQIIDGTCGFSDSSLARCKRFYPPGTKTTAEKLAYYSTRFGCVEIDTSTYAIPRRDVVAEWVANTPAGFVFHIKAFGLFPARKAPVTALPRAILDILPPEITSKKEVKLADLPEAAVTALWDRFNAVCQVLKDGDRLGTVLFQFPTGFVPCAESIAHVEFCRARLDATFPMTVEFRDHRWLGYKSANGMSPEDLTAPPSPHPNGGGSDEALLQQTLAMCVRLKLGFVSSDDLKHEFVGKDEPDAFEAPVSLPTHTFVPHPAHSYIRVHRRAGTSRMLRPEEVAVWVARVRALCAQTAGPVYFMWATDHEYQPIQNADNMIAALRPLGLVYDWPAHLRKVCKTTTQRLTTFFAKKTSGAAPGRASDALASSGAASVSVERSAVVAFSPKDEVALPSPPLVPPVAASPPTPIPVPSLVLQPVATVKVDVVGGAGAVSDSDDDDVVVVSVRPSQTVSLSSPSPARSTNLTSVSVPSRGGGSGSGTGSDVGSKKRKAGDAPSKAASASSKSSRTLLSFFSKR